MIMTNSILTQVELKRLLHYNQNTGLFTRKVRTANCMKVGDIAGYVNTHKDGKKYVVVRVNTKKYYAHILAVLYMTGWLPKGEVDHDDGDGTNNRWGNINDVTSSDNRKNRRMPSNNSTGCVGVYLRKDKYFVSISINKRPINLGTHDCIFEAACARKSAENKHGFHPSHGSIRPL